MSLKNSRRRFLKGSLQGLAGLGFSELVLNQLFNRLTGSAFASTLAPNPSGYYFNLSLPSGPPRWLFDLPLTPMGKTASNFKAGGFGTTLEVVSGRPRTSYNVVKKNVGGKTLYLPPVWNYHTSKNFDSVLAHTLFVRGMDMEINNHGVSNQRQIAPIIGGLSINGAVADKSERPLPAITDNGSGAATGFKSARGIVATIANTASTSNIITGLLASFRAIPTNRLHNKDQNLALQEQVFEKLELEMLKMGYTENSLAMSYDQATDLIVGKIQSIANNYPALVAKYQNLVSDAWAPKRGSLVGLNDSKIVPTLSSQFGLTTNVPASTLKLGDLRDMANANVTIPRMAQNFALMELFTDRLSTAFSMSFGNPTNLQVSSTAKMTISNDQHSTGVMVSTYITTLYYRAFLSCLSEFVGFLKAKNIFEDSVIHISSEFNRNPRKDGSGADHGVHGSCATLISGKFSSPQVIGNIKINGADSRGEYSGTWGASANYNLGGVNRPINVNDIARSITAMLSVSDVVANGRPLVQPTSGKFWVPQKVEAKNV